jgi:hypothetical protein
MPIAKNTPASGGRSLRVEIAPLCVAGILVESLARARLPPTRRRGKMLSALSSIYDRGHENLFSHDIGLGIRPTRAIDANMRR